MKHIKKYKLFESTTQDIDKHISIIKDVLQDVIDDYNIEIVESYNDIGNGYFGVITEIEEGQSNFASIMVNFLSNGSELYSDFSKFEEGVEKSLNRLNTIGYKVNPNSWGSFRSYNKSCID